MRAVCIFVFGTLANALVICHGQVDKEGITAQLRLMRNEVETIGSTDESVIKARNSLRVTITDIILRLDDFKQTFPDIYLTSLKNMNAFAHRAKMDNNATEQKSILEHIDWDLQIKFKERKNNLNSQFFNGLLEVTVSCSRNGQAAKNLRVRYAALGYLVNTDRPDGSFGELTSPAKDKMIPGYYQIWVTQDGNYAVLRSWIGEISPDKSNLVQMELQQ